MTVSPLLASKKYQVELALVARLEPHPLSDEVFGQLPDDQLQDLTDDIDANGLNNPLELDGYGRVIKGSQRLRAVKLLGWPEVPVIRRPELLDELVIQASLIKDNTLRRQLTPMQMVRAGVKLEGIYREQAIARQTAGKVLAPQESKVPRNDRSTAGRVAKDLGVSRRRYTDAKTVFEQGPDELKDRVDRGEVSVTQAAQQVKASRPRVQAPTADANASAALRYARWRREIDGWTKQVAKLTRWVQENPTERLGPYAERAAPAVQGLRAALAKVVQEIAGD